MKLKIESYITFELQKTFLLIALLLSSIAILNQFAGLLSDAASGSLSSQFIMQLVLLYLPEIFVNILPVAFFIAIIFVLSRMWSDGEMMSLQTSGYSWQRLMKIILINAVYISFFIGFLSLYLLPLVNLKREKILAEGEAAGMVNYIMPGRFQLLNDERLAFYIENKLKNNQLEHVFIAKKPQKLLSEPWVIVSADTAKIAYSKQGTQLQLNLYDGYRYMGKAGYQDFTILEFDEYLQNYKSTIQDIANHDRVLSSAFLLASSKLSHRAELQWRLAMPLAILILVLIGVGLSKIDPRSGRFNRLLPGIIIYIAYFNLLTVAKRWMAVGKISPILGLWWIHLLFLVFGVVYLCIQSGKWRYWRHHKL